MDFTDPKFWTDGLGVVRNAPQIVGPLVVLAAGAGYWLKSAWAKSEKEGLLQRVGVLEERVRSEKEGLLQRVGVLEERLRSEKEGLLQRVGVLEERLRLWKEREEDVRQKLDESEKKRDELEKRIQELEAQIAAGAPEEELAETSAKVDTAYRDFVTANNEFVSVAKKPMPWMDDVTDRSDTPLPSRAKTTLPSE